jgi:ankyrin repeat protein
MVASLRYGSAPLIALMLAKGADVNAKDEKRNDTALSLAASVGDVETMRLLLAKGADPRRGGQLRRDAHRGCRLRKTGGSCAASDPEGVDVNAASTQSGLPQRNGPLNRSQVTALHNAAAFGPVEIVREATQGRRER